MMCRMKKEFLCCCVAIALVACSEDVQPNFDIQPEDGVTTHSVQPSITWIDANVSVDTVSLPHIDLAAPSFNKSSPIYPEGLEGAPFRDGGFVMVAGQYLPTVVIGNQRWTTADFKGLLQLDSGNRFDNKLYGNAMNPDSTLYYSYKLAMLLEDSPTLFNAYPPTGLKELSKWRIPEVDDFVRLCYMAESDYVEMNRQLATKTNGMIYHDYSDYNIQIADTIPILRRPDEAIYWCSDWYGPNSGKTRGTSGPYGTWHLVAFNGVDFMYIFQFQMMMPHAAIRLVQDIEPLYYPGD